MGLKYYLNLFKENDNDKAVKSRYYLNTFTFIIYISFFVIFFYFRQRNVIVSSIFGILTMIMYVFIRILGKGFIRLIDILMEKEGLNNEDEVDSAFIAYRKGYENYNKETKKLNKRLLPVNIVLTLAVIALLPATITFNLLGKAYLAEKSLSISACIMFIYFIAIFILSITISRKGIWYQEYSAELSIINKYKSGSSCTDIKYKILEDKNQNKQLEYIFPDLALRRRFIIIQRVFLLGLVLGLFVCVAVLILVLANFVEGKVLGKLLLFFIILSIIGAIIVTILQSRCIKKQYRILKENEQENSLYIKLHELRTPFMRKWSILFPVYIIANVLSNIIFAGILSLIIKSDSYGYIFFIIFAIEFIATFIIYFKAYGKIRLKMISIENEIDEINRERQDKEWKNV